MGRCVRAAINPPAWAGQSTPAPGNQTRKAHTIMSIPTTRSTAQIVSALGANSQEQHWVKEVVVGSLGRNIFAKLMGDVMGGKPIMTVNAMQNLRGVTANITVEAPLGGPGRQGSSQQRSDYGEQIKRKLYTLTMGNHWQGVKENNIARSQTVMGLGGTFDVKAKTKLKEYFAHLRPRVMEARIRRACSDNPNRCLIYAGYKTSTEDLRSAHTADTTLFKRMSNTLTNNQASPFAVARKGLQEIEKFLIVAPENTALDDLLNSDDWQTLMSNGSTRGAENVIFTGEMPEWAGSVILPWQVQTNTADGPQGALCSPIAYLGAAVTAGSAAFNLKGGGNTAAADLTDRLYFEYFPGADFTKYERAYIAAELVTTKYALIQNPTNGKFGMISYTTFTDGTTAGVPNQIVGVKKLGSGAAGTVATTIGNVTYNGGVWAGKHIDAMNEAFPVGSPIYPCNSYGQPFVSLYGIGKHCLIQGWGSVDGETSLGRRTVNHNDDHQRVAEIGFEEQWGIDAALDANGLPNGLVMAYAAFNPPGLPVIV